ncbi:uncharacterized protein LOC117103904 isoform X2 [Anneissia japonica]|uniref:uncharacterized protein LOC117103904 isoform X2 n=1 Tax=Anneissia japonica TaxID=1529436 RepID=UPI001425891C|nr:uncharacterized protein LOC117103904 isoform X2 [Anneissia japonica]
MNIQGVYVGQDKVIHLSAPGYAEKSKASAYVHRVSLKQFKYDSDKFEIIPCPRNISREEVVRRAESAENRLFNNKPYDLITNNCEHFARWCHGEAESKQVQDVATWTLIGGAAVLGVVGLAAAFLSDDKQEEDEKPHFV